MIIRLGAIAAAFVSGFATLAAINDGANGWLTSHVGIAVGFATGAALLIAD